MRGIKTRNKSTLLFLFFKNILSTYQERGTLLKIERSKTFPSLTELMLKQGREQLNNHLQSMINMTDRSTHWCKELR